MDADVAPLERIERETWRSFVDAAPPDFAKSVGLERAPIGGALFMMMRRVPAFQFNWLAGAGLEDNDTEAVGEALGRFRAAGQTKFIIQIPPGLMRSGSPRGRGERVLSSTRSLGRSSGDRRTTRVGSSSTGTYARPVNGRLSFSRRPRSPGSACRRR